VIAGTLTNQVQIESALSAEQVEVRLTSDLKSPDAVKRVEAADLGITDALVGVAETGTVILVTERELDRLASALPPNHIVLLERGQMIGSMDEVAAFIGRSIQESNYTVSVITGPSSTADIEETLVRGVHGPHSLYVVIIG
jgi:L-lactate dehydrogenase complex protein LldG